MCPSAPRVCSEPGGQRPVLSLSLDLISHINYIYIYIYITPYKYDRCYSLNQTRGHQEETHNPSYKLQRLFRDLYLIYMTTASIFDVLWTLEESQLYAHMFVYIYICINTNTNVLLLKPASNDFGCKCEQSWKDQCSMEVYITINRTKSYCSKLLTKLVITTKNFFYIRYAT